MISNFSPQLVGSLAGFARFISRSVALAALSGFAVLSTSAATYYVSSSGGNDANDGLSETTPWATLSQINGLALNPADKVLFKRGDTWTGAGLLITSSGLENQPVVYDAYPEGGTDAKPVIDVNHAAGTHGILLDGKDYVTVRNLDVRNADGSSSYGGVWCTNAHHIVLSGIDVTKTGNAGINLSQGGHILVDHCTVTLSGDGAIYCRGSVDEPLHDVTIENCTVHDLNGKADGFTLHQRSSDGFPPIGANFILRNNVAYKCREQGFDIVSGTNVLLEHNISYNNDKGGLSLGHSADGVTIRYHQSWNEPVQDTESTIKIGAPNVTIEYSTFIGSSTNGKPLLKFTQV